jgi:hypothetical protein
MNAYSLTKFSPEVANELKYYVYRLIDPRNGETFYVGKGKDNRVFQHIKGVLVKDDFEQTNTKLKTIRDINATGLEVIHVIHRHGMSKETALEVEAALLDAYPGTTNIMGGYGSNDFGPMNAKEIIDKYSAETAIFKHRVIMITINKSILEKSTYDATRFAWKINKKKADLAEYVISVSQGIIKDVFVVDEKGWREATIINFPELISENIGRYGFSGYKAPETILRQYCGKRIPNEFRKKGAVNPIKYNY